MRLFWRLRRRLAPGRCVAWWRPTGFGRIGILPKSGAGPLTRRARGPTRIPAQWGMSRAAKAISPSLIRKRSLRGQEIWRSGSCRWDAVQAIWAIREDELKSLRGRLRGSRPPNRCQSSCAGTCTCGRAGYCARRRSTIRCWTSTGCCSSSGTRPRVSFTCATSTTGSTAFRAAGCMCWRGRSSLSRGSGMCWKARWLRRVGWRGGVWPAGCFSRRSCPMTGGPSCLHGAAARARTWSGRPRAAITSSR